MRILGLPPVFDRSTHPRDVRHFLCPWDLERAHVPRDILVPTIRLPPALHPAANILCAAALLDGPHAFLGILRAPDPERPDVLAAEILTPQRLAQGAYVVGTSDHSEGFPLGQLPVIDLLSGLCLSSDLALSAFRVAIDRLHTRNFFPGAPSSPSAELSEDDIQGLAAALTGMVCSGIHGPGIRDPDSSDGASLPLGTAAWLLPVRLQGSDFAAIPQDRLDVIRAHFDGVLGHILLRPHANAVLQGIGGLFAPLLKDLVRFCATTLKEGDPGLETYRRVAASTSFLAATRQWEAAQAAEANA